MFTSAVSELGGERAPASDDVPLSDDIEPPDWLEHPVYRELVDDAELVRDALATGPAARRTAELAGIDPRPLTAGERIDLLAVLAEQQRWLEAAQARVLAEIANADSSQQGLGQEAVSLVLRIPLPAA